MLPDRRAFVAQMRHPVNNTYHHTVSICAVPDCQLERDVNVALLHVAADVDVMLSLTSVSQAMDRPRVRVKVEDDRYVVCKECTEFIITKAMRMLVFGDQLEQIDDVNKPDFDL
jgi:hypothetical protein